MKNFVLILKTMDYRILFVLTMTLEQKNLDMIVANDVSKPQAGFNVDTNLIKLLKRDGSIEELPLMSKKDLAYIILNHVMKIYRQHN